MLVILLILQTILIKGDQERYDNNKIYISNQAMLWASASRKSRMKGMIKGYALSFLDDARSLHEFLQEHIVQQLNLPIIVVSPF